MELYLVVTISMKLPYFKYGQTDRLEIRGVLVSGKHAWYSVGVTWTDGQTDRLEIRGGFLVSGKHAWYSVGVI